ncbi:Neuropilin-2 Vascular endothelial cell growth factor 165 receptor 2 [Takifugu flavidus]|uniref:Neuropilin-2 Vascular endothelial cell growth factor 165 receptor 2 n=1 Tax=Takifugu flavidus TaxID=433684 RepID=A0A5C6PQJ2_9TELE|nr:Neuropilin-2 Vascular endothelial cell growth factor 165 receptor 2 [Takifugu flavidus]
MVSVIHLSAIAGHSCDRLLIFEGNSHYDTPEVRRFEELVAQYIRVFPERWSPLASV